MGRDLLVQLVNSPFAAFVQIKGTAVRRGDDLVRFHVRRKTFVPADDFWLALYFWEERLRALFPECWPVSSRELARRTNHHRAANMPTPAPRFSPSVLQWG